MSFSDQEKSSAKQTTFNIGHMHGVIGDPKDSHINIFDFSTINQALKDHGIPQSDRNELENLLDDLKAKPHEKQAITPRILEWIAKNAPQLGTLAIEMTKAFTAS